MRRRLRILRPPSCVSTRSRCGWQIRWASAWCPSASSSPASTRRPSLPARFSPGCRVPAVRPDPRSAYLKFCPRSAEDKPLIGVAALLAVDAASRVSETRISLGGAAPTPSARPSGGGGDQGPGAHRRRHPRGGGDCGHGRRASLRLDGIGGLPQADDPRVGAAAAHRPQGRSSGLLTTSRPARAPRLPTIARFQVRKVRCRGRLWLPSAVPREGARQTPGEDLRARRSMSDNGRLRHGDGDPTGGNRCRRGLVLTILMPRRTLSSHLAGSETDPTRAACYARRTAAVNRSNRAIDANGVAWHHRESGRRVSDV
jgi:hypothetical protein